jgi:hypothetical protein
MRAGRPATGESSTAYAFASRWCEAAEKRNFVNPAVHRFRPIEQNSDLL